MSAPKLTAAQVRALEPMIGIDIEISARTPYQRQLLRNAEKARRIGVLRFCWRTFDYGRGKLERLSYEYTDAGRAALAAHEAER